MDGPGRRAFSALCKFFSTCRRASPRAGLPGSPVPASPLAPHAYRFTRGAPSRVTSAPRPAAGYRRPPCLCMWLSPDLHGSAACHPTLWAPPWPVPGSPVLPPPAGFTVAPRPGIPHVPHYRAPQLSPVPGSPPVAPSRAPPSPPLTGSPAALAPGLHRGLLPRSRTWPFGLGFPVLRRHGLPRAPPSRRAPPSPPVRGSAGKRGSNSLSLDIQYKTKATPLERYVV